MAKVVRVGREFERRWEEVRRLSVTSECGELFIGKITARDPEYSSGTLGGVSWFILSKD